MPLLRLAALVAVPALLAAPAARPTTVPSRPVAAAPVPRAAETCVYFEGSGRGTNYFFSGLVTLPFGKDALVYDDAGRAALQRARQAWMNRVQARHEDELFSNSVYTIWPDVRTCEEHEAHRLRAVRDKKGIYNIHVFVVE